MSLATDNASANRGACVQNCRKSYRLLDDETGQELKVDNEYIMSPKDLCTIGFIDRLIKTGVSVFKIEGRGRSPDYVHTVIQTYREAIDAFYDGEYTTDKVKSWTTALEKVYNRGFWHGGYYCGIELGEWSGTYGSQAKTEKKFIGRVTHYFDKAGIGEIQVEKDTVAVGDALLVTGVTTGVVEDSVKSIYHDDTSVKSAARGSLITIPIGKKVRKGDKVYVVVARD